MDDTSLKRLITEEKATILEKDIAHIEGRTGELLKLLVSYYLQGLTRTEIKKFWWQKTTQASCCCTETATFLLT